MRWSVIALGYMAICITAASADAAPGQWAVRTSTDSMTDAVTKTAYVANADGFEFSVYLVPDRGDIVGNAWFNFSLPTASRDTLHPGKVILYRIDKWPPVDVSRQISTGRDFPDIPLIEAAPKWVSFRALLLTSHGAEHTIRQFQRGTTLVVRYFLPTGGYKETTFSLTGARAAIAAALGITANFDEQEESEKDKLFQAKDDLTAARRSATSRCWSAAHPNDTLRCTNFMGDCVRAFGEDTVADIQKKIVCLDSIQPYGPAPNIPTDQGEKNQSLRNECAQPKRQVEDSVASQIRKAAEDADDAELSKALWAEYKKYMDGC